MTQNQDFKSNIWTKLMQIQRTCPSFSNTEPSEKKKQGSKASSYDYTPGWKIVETVKGLMNNAGLMLLTNIKEEKHEMIDYPVYKIINGQLTTCQKKELLSTLKVEFTWLDTESGEKTEPFMMVASGANGTDKSTASALSFAERYFLLKFFHLTTKDPTEELDAHDSSYIPGLKDQPVDATMEQMANAQPAMAQPMNIPPQQGYYPAAPQGYIPYPQCPSQMTYQQQPMNGMQGYPQTQQIPVQQAPVQSQVQHTMPPQETKRPAVQPNEVKKITYADAVNQLCYFAKGTLTHQAQLHKLITELKDAGYHTQDQAFINRLIEDAQTKRIRQSAHAGN